MFGASVLIMAFWGTVPEPKKLPIAPAPRARVPAHSEDQLGDFQGEVLSIENLSITIRGNPPGAAKKEAIIRSFPAGLALAAGKQDEQEHMTTDYRLSDVKKGDKVYIRIRQKGDEYLCVSVSILRRPGGLVPIAPWDDLDREWPHHLVMNAHQAFEEKGVPLPAEIDRNIDTSRTEEGLKEEERMKKFRENGYRWSRFEPAPPPRPVIRK